VQHSSFSQSLGDTKLRAASTAPGVFVTRRANCRGRHC